MEWLLLAPVALSAGVLGWRSRSRLLDRHDERRGRRRLGGGDGGGM